MRIWRLHPQYLDPKGLVTLWRETLLVKLERRAPDLGEPPAAADDPLPQPLFKTVAGGIADWERAGIEGRRSWKTA